MRPTSTTTNTVVAAAAFVSMSNYSLWKSFSVKRKTLISRRSRRWVACEPQYQLHWSRGRGEGRGKWDPPHSHTHTHTNTQHEGPPGSPGGAYFQDHPTRVDLCAFFADIARSGKTFTWHLRKSAVVARTLLHRHTSGSKKNSGLPGHVLVHLAGSSTLPELNTNYLSDFI